MTQGREDFAGDVAFETADDLSLAHPLPGAAVHVLPGPEVMPKPESTEGRREGWADWDEGAYRGEIRTARVDAAKQASTWATI